MRIELTTSAWKAEVLPLNYTRKWRETESNRRHMELQSIALPTELPSQNTAVKRRCLNPLTNGPSYYCAVLSNSTFLLYTNLEICQE